MNAKQAILQAMLVNAIIETVIEAKYAPEGPMYAAFMTKGVTLEQFNSLVAAAVATGRITKRGNMLSAVQS